MEEELDFSEVPHQYTACLHQQCPQADTCLRRLVAICMPDDIADWSFIPPRYLAAQQGSCPHYRPRKRVRYARGFIKTLNKLPHKQMQEIVYLLTHYFNRRTYYRVRKGERPLSPSEQQGIRDLLKRHGVEEPWKFDDYFDTYDW